MHITINRNRGVAQLSASNKLDNLAIDKILSRVKIGSEMSYGGRRGGNLQDPHNSRMSLLFLTESFQFRIRASNDLEESDVRLLRDAIFFGGGGIIFLGHYVKNEVTVVEVCVDFCKDCHSPITSYEQTTTKLCEDCLAKCEHSAWKEGLLVSSEGCSFGEYCTRCLKAREDIESKQAAGAIA